MPEGKRAVRREISPLAPYVRRLTEQRAQRMQHKSDSEEDDLADLQDSRAKKQKNPEAVGKRAVDDTGEAFWPLNDTGNRRVTISAFNGKMMVNIREFYEKDGKMLPGKKGISLPLEQYSALMKALPGLESELAGKGQTDIARPTFGAAPELSAGKKRKMADEDADEDAADGDNAD